MPFNAEITCFGCEADFTIQSEMDEEMYPIQGCPFCLEPFDVDLIADIMAVEWEDPEE